MRRIMFFSESFFRQLIIAIFLGVQIVAPSDDDVVGKPRGEKNSKKAAKNDIFETIFQTSKEKSLADGVYVTKDGLTYSEGDGTLVPSDSLFFDGSDILGLYTADEVSWAPEHLHFRTSRRLYRNTKIGVFKLEFFNLSETMNGTRLGDGPKSYDGISSCYPTMISPNLGDDTKKVGFMSFGGNMAGWTALSVGEWNATLTPWEMPFRGGELGGPVAFFDDKGSEVVVVSSLTNFMVSNTVLKWFKDEESNYSFPYLDFGLMASIESIPAPGIELEVIAVGGISFNDAFQRWGDAMLRYHGKTNKDDSLISKYLGYWTDNGAFYYYNTLGEDSSYEGTFIELHKHFDSINLPIRYAEIDSWWYYKDETQGVTNWTELPEIFPNGLDQVQQLTGFTFAAHNRYWSKETVYAKENGGKYDFYIEENGALPKDPKFWDYLFREGSKWGLRVYEQDWLDIQYRYGSVTHTDVQAARNWLVDMGHGAEINSIEVIYCMALPREVLQSVELDSVKTARVSGDYILSKDQWRVGLSSFLSSSLGLAPFKDVFWTKTENAGSPFYYDCMIVSNNTDPNIPWTLNYRYNGYKNVAKSGKPCLNWYDLDLHWTAPNGDLERDACRTLQGSPWGDGKPFCFVEADPAMDPSLWIWEECEIPICGEDCYRDGYDAPIEGVPKCDSVNEPNPYLQAAVSVLSRGGVGIGDKIGNIDRDLVMKTCREDGQILRPDVPARAVPVQILRMAFSDFRNHRRPHYEFGEIWQTWTDIEGFNRFYTLFLGGTKGYFTLNWDDLGIEFPNSYLKSTYTVVTTDHRTFSDYSFLYQEEDLVIPNVGDDGMNLIHISPNYEFYYDFKFVMVALLGEMSKFVPISKDRINGITTRDHTISIDVKGAANETVEISWYIYPSDGTGEYLTVSTCQLSRSGRAKFQFDVKEMKKSCYGI